jgi:hypothetical protein
MRQFSLGKGFKNIFSTITGSACKSEQIIQSGGQYLGVEIQFQGLLLPQTP